jgi:replicative DNA helicase
MILPDPTQENQLLSAALSYSRRNWQVLPVHTVADGRCTCDDGECKSIAKHPLLQDGSHGASSDAGVIARWWAEAPPANVAIRTGPDSGLWVLDADGAAGLDILARLEAEHGPLPRTPTARTGRGGKHYYFAWAAGVEIRNAVKVAGTPIDVRGLGGYAIAPPSLHAVGNRYHWEVSPDEVPLAQAPTWLLDWVTGNSTPRAGKLRVLADDLADAPGVEEGRRHAEALRLVGHALARGVNPEALKASALAWARRCTPPLPDDEVRRIVDDLATKQAGRAEPPPSAWELPTPFDDFVPTPFPIAALPGWLREFVTAQAVATQTPPDLAAMLTLSVIAATCARRVAVVVKDGYAEPLNIFTATALPPGNRKSAVFSGVTDPLVDFEQSEALRLGPEIAEAQARLEIAQARLGRLQADAVKAKPQEQEALIQQAAALARENSETRIPAAARLVAADTTAEQLASLLQANGGRMAVLSPEGDVFDVMAGRYSGSVNIGVYLSGHAGDDLRVDRVGRPPEFVKGPALTVGLAVQPEVIRGLAAQPGFRGRGLLARFLYALPTSLVGRRDPDPPAVPAPIREEYHRRVRALLALKAQEVKEGDVEPHALGLDDDARRRLVGLATWIEPQLAEAGELGHIADWAGKLVGAVVRIAGILHMAEHAGQPAPWATPIVGATMERAIQIGHYLIAHARAAFALMGTDPTVEDARLVLAWVARRGGAAFSRRDLFQGVKGRFKRVDALQPALSLLVSHDYIRERPGPERPGPGRKPSQVYEVNPRAVPRNSHNPRNSDPPALAEQGRPNSEDCGNTESGPAVGHGTATADTVTIVEFDEFTL